MGLHRALIIDDEPDIRELLELTLGRMDIDTDAAADIAEARQLLKDKQFDLCLTDMRLPDGDGIELVEYIQTHCPKLPVAVITAYGSMEAAVQALKAGAFDFVSKPVDLEMLRNLVNSAMKLAAPGAVIDRRSRNQLLGESEVMRQVRSNIAKLARSQAPVYISGESGTGKELVAQLIHQKGPRAEKAFVPVNCGAIPTELMESEFEFFGHIKGSFTGAVSDKQGLFQAAQGGTLFLDEIAELPMHMQVKLLRAIQEKAIRPIGGHEEIPIDVRILSATHKDLAAKVKNDEFRQDLFYRINVINITVPPLRERTEDIPQLVEHILNRLQASTNNETAFHLSDDAMKALQNYPFSGNVRELENILERALALCEGKTIGVNDLHLPEAEHEPPEAESSDLDHALDNRERQMIINALEKSRYNKTAAAKLLGISYRALRYRLKKYDIS